MEYASHTDVPEGKMRRFRPSVFRRRTRESKRSSRAACASCRDADAGGFFVCVLRKEGSTVAETAADRASPRTSPTAASSPRT